MDLGLTNTIALVVGGTGLIGSHTARALKDEGATVVVAARSADTLAAIAAELGVDSVVLDTGDDASVVAAVSSVIDRYGRIDVLVVSAAPSAGTLDSSRDRDPAQVLSALDAKALGFLRVAEAVAPHMVEAGSGRIVALSGQNARLTFSVTGSVRNIALITIAKALADGYAGTGVAVNVVNPGAVRDGASTEAPDRATPGESTPAQVAALVTFLASPAAGGISGESIAVGHKVMGVTSAG